MADCHRCGESVYAADRTEHEGLVWHKACFTCSACGCKLNSAIAKAKDGDFFCDRCVKKQKMGAAP